MHPSTNGTAVNPEYFVGLLFSYFVRGGLRTKIKCMRKVQSKSENPQRWATVRKCHAYERLESLGYMCENWVRTNYSGFTVSWTVRKVTWFSISYKAHCVKRPWQNVSLLHTQELWFLFILCHKFCKFHFLYRWQILPKVRARKTVDLLFSLLQKS